MWFTCEEENHMWNEISWLKLLMNMEQWTDDFGVQFEKDENGVVSLVNAPENIKEYAIPDYVTEIGKCAFSQCYDLTKISIPNLSAFLTLFLFSLEYL